MVYLSKLAKRLAVAGPFPVGVALVFLGCVTPEQREFLGPNDSSKVTSLSVEPEIGTVRPGEIIRFTATARDAVGSVILAEIDWSATGGTITGDGVFTSDQLGQFQVSAKVRGNAKIADTVRVSVFLHPTDVVNLTVSPDESEINAGEGIQLEATAVLADGRTVVQPPLAWTTTTGTIDGTGYYTAPETEGTYPVRASASSGVYADAAVKVKPGRRVLTRIDVRPGTSALVPGGTQQFEAIGIYDDGSEKAAPVVWSSTGGSITSGGLFTAGSTVGTYRVIARFKQGTQADTSTVTISEPEIVALNVSPDGSTLTTGASQQYVATARLSNGSTRNASPAWQATGGTITSNGLYTAGSTAGAYRVIATVQGQAADTVSVTVTKPSVTLTSLLVNPSRASVPVGTSRQFSVTGTWSDGSNQTPPVTWSATGGTVTASGLYTAGKTPGTYRLIATNTQYQKADTATILVEAPQLVSLTLSPAEVTLQPAQTRQFSVTGTWSDGSTTTPQADWHAEGGTITPAGFYTAGSAAGTYRVIAEHPSGLADTSLVTITQPPPTLVSLSLAPASVNLAPGGSIQFAVSGTWSDGSKSTPSVTYAATGGTISAAGMYTAGTSTGTFRVIATSVVGSKADTATVSITAAAPTLTSLTILPDSTGVKTGGTRQFAVSGTWSDGSTTTPAVVWATNGGTISTSGMYEAPATAGNYRVVATQKNGTRADTAKVTVTAGTTIVSLAVSPEQKTLSPAESQQYSALATYSNGGTGTPSVTWSTTGGSISTSGVYTAPSSAGTYRVIATTGTVKDTALANVVVPTVTSLVLSPSSVTLNPGKTQQFSALATWSDGEAHPLTFSFSATGGTISNGGLYTAGSTTGTYRVIVRCGVPACSKADTSSVTIQSATSTTVASLTIAPKTITLDIGEVYQFSATAKRSDGSTVSGVTLAWSTSGGLIDGSGQYRAPRTAGTYTVTVRHSGGASDNATVTVVVPTGPYFSDNFDYCGTLNKSASPAGFLWSDTQGGTGEAPVVSSAARRSGSCSLRFTWVGTTDLSDDAWSEQRFRFGKKLSEVYLRWYAYYPAGTESAAVGPKYYHRNDPNGPDNNKLLRLWDDDYTSYNVKGGFSTLPTSTGDSQLNTEYIWRSADGSGNAVANVGPWTTIVNSTTRGKWVKYQVRMKLASSGTANDGVLQLWMNDVLIANYTALPLYSGQAGAKNYIRNGYIMGWANSGFNQTTHMYIDDFVISATPIP
jgi:hypothetical protein